MELNIPSNTSDLLLPNAYIAGIAKAGSTSLFYWLHQHPEVCGTSEKETFFLVDEVFSLNEDANIHDHGLEKYQVYFEHYNGERILLEGTPTYYANETALEVLPELDPLPKVIICLRKPSDRIFSFYRYDVFTTQLFDSFISFEEYLQTDRGKKQVDRSDYPKYLGPWIEKLGREQIQFVLFRNLADNPKGVLKRISRFLDISPDYWDDFDFFQKNKSKKITNHKLHMRLLKARKMLPGWITNSHFLQQIYYRLNSSKLPGPSPKDIALKKQLEQQFAPSVEELEKLIGIDLSIWKSEKTKA